MDKTHRLNVLLLLTVLITLVSSKILRDQVEIAINCGGPQFTNEDGVVYQKVYQQF
jgi:hypothetical protein